MAILLAWGSVGKRKQGKAESGEALSQRCGCCWLSEP